MFLNINSIEKTAEKYRTSPAHLNFETKKMNTPKLSNYFSQKSPSAIRMAQMEFAKRNDGTKAINVSIGNVSLPMHPAMQKRMFELNNPDSPLKDWVVKYTQTVGNQETIDAFLNIVKSSWFPTENLFCQITDGGSQAMELVLLGVSDANDRPILLIDPAYTNYMSFAQRVGRKTITITRNLQDDGTFTLPSKEIIEETITQYNPSAIVVIPYDNPTGQYYTQEDMITIAKLSVEHNMRIISDEAYRELQYHHQKSTSIRGIDNTLVPGIEGRRISIESASKVRNACWLRIGAIITDNAEFHQQAVAENTTALCSSTIGQYIFGSLAHLNKEELQARYEQQRTYYGSMLNTLTSAFKEVLPGIIVSSPDASIYSVIDVKHIAKPDFDAKTFVLFCAQQGYTLIDNQKYTVLTSPMSGFYNNKENPGKTQMRISFVESPEQMKLVPYIFAELFKQYENTR